MIIPISNLNDPALEVYTSCKEAQLLHYYEPHGGLFLAETPMILRRALQNGYQPMSLLVENGHEGQVEEIFESLGKEEIFKEIPIYTADHEAMVKMTGYELTRGVLGAMRRGTMPSLKEIVSSCRRIAVLEDVMNPTNVGAIFRSAAALGMDGVILTKGAADPLYRRAIRVSMGTVFDIPWIIVSENGEWIRALKENGFKIISMALTDEAVSLRDISLKEEEKAAMVFGTESTGIRPATLNDSDHIAIIPMQHGVDSLNVAAASAVAFWEINKA
ncbi:MAG: RNA methyltransferase [Lachnospiraceae bacterium]|nr:RNA methyltransferase [Candidatus Equihabitans merdae]